MLEVKADALEQSFDACCVHRAYGGADRRLAGELIQPLFNASKLASVKIMLERLDDVLDVAGDAAELAHGFPRGLGAGRVLLQRGKGGCRAGERGGDLLGIARDLRADHAVGVIVAARTAHLADARRRQALDLQRADARTVMRAGRVDHVGGPCGPGRSGDGG